MNYIFFLIFIILALPLPAMAATPLVADLSNYSIQIDSGFNGTRMFLFGARNDAGDVVVVIRGPNKDYVVRKKERIAGIWANRDAMKFRGVPDFYAVASSKPLSDIEQNAIFHQLGIGQENLVAAVADHANTAYTKQFMDAFLRYQQGRRLYRQEAENMTFMGETLFKTVVEFPDDIPPGDYTAEIYLISDGEVTGMQSTPITVVKSGIDEFLYNYAHQHAALYGISAVFMALSIGWFTGKMFERG